MLYLLDTDHMTALERGGTGAGPLAGRLRAISADDYGTTIISFEEQTRGRLAQIHGAKDDNAEVYCYSQLNETFRFYKKLAIWQCSAQAAMQFVSLRKQGVRIGTKDLKIASIALASGATILTRNSKDFGKVPGLLLQDWTP